jgi:cbb3-type cytochrome oxidase subunit 3
MSKIFSLKNFLTIIIALFLFSGFFTNSIFATCKDPGSLTALQRAEVCMNDTAIKGFGTVDSESISSKIGKVIGVALSFVGVIFLVLIIYAGFTWMLARGNEAEAKKAKDLMFDAVIGLVIILAAYAITAFVGKNLT